MSIRVDGCTDKHSLMLHAEAPIGELWLTLLPVRSSGPLWVSPSSFDRVNYKDNRQTVSRNPCWADDASGRRWRRQMPVDLKGQGSNPAGGLLMCFPICLFCWSEGMFTSCYCHGNDTHTDKHVSYREGLSPLIFLWL